MKMYHQNTQCSVCDLRTPLCRQLYTSEDNVTEMCAIRTLLVLSVISEHRSRDSNDETEGQRYGDCSMRTLNVPSVISEHRATDSDDEVLGQRYGNVLHQNT